MLLPAQRFDRTYEELKQNYNRRKIRVLLGFDRTYEELKQIRSCQFRNRWIQSFDRTYEELKQVRIHKLRQQMQSFDRTYEELKLHRAGLQLVLERVLIVPMRN